MATQRSIQFAQKIDNYINKYPALFAYGNTMSWKAFRRRFGFLKPGLATATPETPRGAAVFVAAYGRLNRTLAAHGRYIQASDYYTTFTSVTAKQVDKKVKNYSDKSKGNGRAAINLVSGVVRAQGTISPLPSNEIDRIANYTYTSPFAKI